jgi:hypothetical protein
VNRGDYRVRRDKILRVPYISRMYKANKKKGKKEYKKAKKVF